MLNKLKAFAASVAKRFAPKPAGTEEARSRHGKLAIFIVTAADRLFLFACCCTILAVYILDAIFFASTGGKVWWVFLIVALAFRSFTVSAGVILNSLRNVAWVRDSRRTIRAVQLACFVACLYPPVNFFAASHFEKAAQADSVSAVETASTGSKDARIKSQRERLDRAKETRDTAILAAKDAQNIIRDQVKGTSEADNATLQKLQADIGRYLDTYSKVEGEVNSAITTIEAEREVIQTDAAAESATTFHTWPVFIWLGDHMPGSDLDWANWSLFYFAMLVEFCALLALGAYTRIHRAFAEVIAAIEAEEDPPTKAPNKPAEARIIGRESSGAGPVEERAEETPVETTLTPQQIAGKKGGQSSALNRRAAADPLKVPTGDWRKRETFEEAA